MNNIDLFLIVLEAGKSKVKGSSWFIEGHFLAVSSCDRMGKERLGDLVMTSSLPKALAS